MSLTHDDLKKLSEPFDEKTIGIKVQSYSKDRTKAMLVAYVQHTDAYARIEQVDPAWTMKITNSTYVGESCFVRVALTIKGVTRENEGEGEDPKSATSDAIKRAAMLFGLGRYLYDADKVWVPFDPNRDQFKKFTYADYKNAARHGQEIAPVSKPSLVPPPASEVKSEPKKVTPKGNDYTPPSTAKDLKVEIGKVAKAIGLTQDVLRTWIRDEFKKASEQMTVPELQKLLEMLQLEAGSQGITSA